MEKSEQGEAEANALESIEDSGHWTVIGPDLDGYELEYTGEAVEHHYPLREAVRTSHLVSWTDNGILEFEELSAGHVLGLTYYEVLVVDELTWEGYGSRAPGTITFDRIRGGLEAQIGLRTDFFRLLLKAHDHKYVDILLEEALSLKIWGFSAENISEARAIAGSACKDILFWLSASRGIDLHTWEIFPEMDVERWNAYEQARDWPDPMSTDGPPLEYPDEAVGCYITAAATFGQQAVRFLAFYQCLELLMNAYQDRPIIRKLRTMICAPDFDPRNEGQLRDVVHSVRTSARRTSKEQSRLTQLINDHIDQSEYASWLRAVEIELTSGLETYLDLRPHDSEQGNWADTLAGRIYQVRCALVHGSERSDIILGLDASRFEDDLRTENVLMRKLCEALIPQFGH